MNFLITGAAGFLGSHLANQLAREGHQVRGLDDLSTGDPQMLDPDVHFTRGDVNDRPKLWTLLQEVDSFTIWPPASLCLNRYSTRANTTPPTLAARSA
jgi:nucleoside-diphosphate-sugar epimerase